MFADCFVSDDVAVALREAGFNEPCMAVHQYHIDSDGQRQSTLLINYSNVPSDPDLFNDLIKEVIREHPNLIRGARRNSDLLQFHFAAPLYKQVHDWLFAKGLRIHDCYLAQEVYNNDKVGAWVYTIYDTKYGKALYPAMHFVWRKAGYEQEEGHTYATQRDAWNDAIIKALKLLSNDKMDV